jgi:hypothetical protein
MSSKFRGILDQAKGRDAEPVEVPADPIPPVIKPSTPRPPAVTPSPPLPVEVPAARRPGRPPGKRSDDRFAQVSAYIPVDLHHEIKLALLQERKGREFSELVAELLADWLVRRPCD